MKEYLRIAKKVLDPNISLMKSNRTDQRHLGYQGDMMKFDLSDGFPAVTTKKLYTRQVFAEMLGFLRGYDSAAQFRELGCNVWDENANNNAQWLQNANRKGEDDLGEIYGVQARRWPAYDGQAFHSQEGIDQLKRVISDLSKGVDNRREIVSHWNPGRLSHMALPPCHLLYQFGLEGEQLNMCMYQRSCDVPLGVPFNIAGYAWLLSVIAQITGKQPGVFTHFLWDIHAYEDQLELLEEQVKRRPKKLPKLWINPAITSLKDLETWVTADDFKLVDYDHHPAIKYPFSV